MATRTIDLGLCRAGRPLIRLGSPRLWPTRDSLAVHVVDFRGILMPAGRGPLEINIWI